MKFIKINITPITVINAFSTKIFEKMDVNTKNKTGIRTKNIKKLILPSHVKK
jgi:hypothetical protein